VKKSPKKSDFFVEKINLNVLVYILSNAYFISSNCSMYTNVFLNCFYKIAASVGAARTSATKGYVFLSRNDIGAVSYFFLLITLLSHCLIIYKSIFFQIYFKYTCVYIILQNIYMLKKHPLSKPFWQIKINDAGILSPEL